MSSLQGPRGAIATPHYLASEAGADMLRAGGNAIDAALASAATLCVVYPNNVALGGDLVALVRSPDGDVQFINATGPMPLGISVETIRARYGQKLPARGADTITVPGGVKGWEALSDVGGSLSWPERLEAAIHYAWSAPVARSLAAALRAESDLLRQDPGARSVFFPEGNPLQANETIRQPSLARSLERLADHGPGEFYTGELGSLWRQGVRGWGSVISENDTSHFSPTIEEPLSADVLGLRVHTGAPNTQGFSLLRTLLSLESESVFTDVGTGTSSRSRGATIAPGAEKLATLFSEGNAVRDAYLADPSCMTLSGRDLLKAPAPSRQLPAGSATGDTVGLSTVSADGWAVSLVQSVYKAFGSGKLDQGTGILFQNRGTAFSLNEMHPAFLAAGKRPPHTLMPVLAEKGGHMRYVLSTMGGQAQPQIHTQLLLHLLGGASPLEAASFPRWMVESAEPTDLPSVALEADVGNRVRSSLESAGYRLRVLPPRSESLGHANLIEVSDIEHYRAASDPRSDGSAVVVE